MTSNLNIRIDGPTKKKLDKLAEMSSMNKSQIVRELIGYAEFLTRYDDGEESVKGKNNHFAGFVEGQAARKRTLLQGIGIGEE